MKSGTGRHNFKKRSLLINEEFLIFYHKYQKKIRETNIHEGGFEVFVVLLGSRHRASHAIRPLLTRRTLSFGCLLLISILV